MRYKISNNFLKIYYDAFIIYTWKNIKAKRNGLKNKECNSASFFNKKFQSTTIFMIVQVFVCSESIMQKHSELLLMSIVGEGGNWGNLLFGKPSVTS